MAINSRYTIVSLLPSELSARVEFAQKRYVNPYWRITIPPHITLMHASTGVASPDTALQIFTAFTLSNISRPTAQSVGMDVFTGPDNANVAYIKIDPTPELNALRETVTKQAAGFCEVNLEFGDFVPHITIANHVADTDATDVIIDETSADNIEVKYVIDRVHLFKKADQDQDWVWLGEKLIG